MKYMLKLIALFSAVLIFTIPAAAEDKPISVEFVVDFSKSMNEKIGSHTKIDMARQIVADILGHLDQPLETGLTFFGHRETDQCDDVTHAGPFQSTDIEMIREKLAEHNAAGNASACTAFTQIADRMKGSDPYKYLVFISDGADICDGDIVAITRTIKNELDYRYTLISVMLNPEKKDYFYMKLAAQCSYGSSFLISDQRDADTVAKQVSHLLNTSTPYVPRIINDEEMVLIPAGEFTMGTKIRMDDAIEYRAHTVYLDAYYIDKLEVTQKQYRDSMGENPSYWIGSDLPVDSVSWFEANEYCQKVGKRLPTEAEWEKAAKGGRDDRWAGTSNAVDLIDYAWISDTDANGRTHPVGKKQPNGYGLYDMSGNVWEWVADWHERFYLSSPEKNPRGPEKGMVKVLRGGNWDSHTYEVQTTSRYAKSPSVKHSNNGFRCAKAAD